MDNHEKKPIAQDAYDVMAESYAVLVDTKPHNAYSFRHSSEGQFVSLVIFRAYFWYAP